MKLYDTEIEKYIFHQSKRAISINKIAINKIVVSDRASSCKNSLKQFIGYKDPRKIRLLCLFYPKTSAYRRDFDKTKLFFDKR